MQIKEIEGGKFTHRSSLAPQLLEITKRVERLRKDYIVRIINIERVYENTTYNLVI